MRASALAIDVDGSSASRRYSQMTPTRSPVRRPPRSRHVRGLCATAFCGLLAFYGTKRQAADLAGRSPESASPFPTEPMPASIGPGQRRPPAAAARSRGTSRRVKGMSLPWQRAGAATAIVASSLIMALRGHHARRDADSSAAPPARAPPRLQPSGSLLSQPRDLRGRHGDDRRPALALCRRRARRAGGRRRHGRQYRQDLGRDRARRRQRDPRLPQRLPPPRAASSSCSTRATAAAASASRSSGSRRRCHDNCFGEASGRDEAGAVGATPETAPVGAGSWSWPVAYAARTASAGPASGWRPGGRRPPPSCGSSERRAGGDGRSYAASSSPWPRRQ